MSLPLQPHRTLTLHCLQSQVRHMAFYLLGWLGVYCILSVISVTHLLYIIFVIVIAEHRKTSQLFIKRQGPHLHDP